VKPATSTGPEHPALEDLLPLRRLLAGLHSTGATPGRPLAVQVCGAPLERARRLVAMAGSFNPPHTAHLALLEAGMAASGADAGVFVLSVRTIDKERVTGLLLEDRLWLLCRQGEAFARSGAAGEGRRPGVVATARGLYVDQARALQRLAPRAGRIIFVTGFDKIVQIFDPRYYEDRDAALDDLFQRATFLVAPRDASTAADLESLLDRAENRRYAGGVAGMQISPDLAGVSSTAVRAAVAAGHGLNGIVPDAVLRHLLATGAFGAPDGEGRYGARIEALDRLVGTLDAG
jgi:nicotinic acid mononucleotide adenylyltransferase